MGSEGSSPSALTNDIKVLWDKSGLHPDLTFQRAHIARGAMEIALVVVGVCLVLYFANRLTLRYYFQPDT